MIDKKSLLKWTGALGTAITGLALLILVSGHTASDEELYAHWKGFQEATFADLVDPNEGLTSAGCQYFFRKEGKAVCAEWKTLTIQEKKAYLESTPVFLRSLYEVVRRYEVTEVSYQFGAYKSGSSDLQLAEDSCSSLGKKKEDYCIFLFHPLATNAQVAHVIEKMKKTWGFEFIESDPRTHI